MQRSVLIVDDEELIRRSLRMALEGAGYVATVAASGSDALAQIAEEPPDCLVIDLRLGDRDGLEVLREVRERHAGVKAVVITAHGDVDSAVRALRLGAFDFIRKPFDLEEILATVQNALHVDELERRVAYYDEGRDRLDQPAVFASSAMHEAWQKLGKIAHQSVPIVLICGETGTGKELAARALHRASARARGPFVEVNCSAIPETLIESELFGHERGAFSDAREQKRGLVELADGGTLFLDEIGDLPASAQAKLLRFTESFDFRRVGGTKLLRVECRIVAATHRALGDDATFRRDLFYRLAGVSVVLPPLRERGNDVILLARHFLEEYARRYRKRLDGFTPEAEALLRAHRWPGNVRELKAAVSNAAVLADGPLVDPELLSPIQRSALADVTRLPNDVSEIVKVDELQLAYVTRVLELCGGNKLLTAQKLGISRQTLSRWLSEPDGGP